MTEAPELPPRDRHQAITISHKRQLYKTGGGAGPRGPAQPSPPAVRSRMARRASKSRGLTRWWSKPASESGW